MLAIVPAAVAGLLAASMVPGAPAPYAAAVDPAGWDNRRLAAQLTVSCVDMAHPDRARRHAAAGIGAITLLGDPPRGLRSELARVRDAAPTRVLPFVASDEEGGAVQRLRSAIYRLPSARTMGTWRPARVRRTAHDYAVRMRRIGVRMDLAPVADLAIRGAYIDELGRAFARDPDRVARMVRAWRLGMRDAGVVTVVKHWPGHGAATNSHTGPARVPALDVLEGRDLVPFERELADGAPVVMVGHLLSEGLTRRGVPASLLAARPALPAAVRRAGRRARDRLAGHGRGELLAGDLHRPGGGARAAGRRRLGDAVRRRPAAGDAGDPPGDRRRHGPPVAGGRLGPPDPRSQGPLGPGAAGVTRRTAQVVGPVAPAR